MNNKQERVAYQEWADLHPIAYAGIEYDAFIAGYQAGRSTQQSQKPEPNNLMLSAVIRMPFEMAMADPISRMQFYQRAQQALNELEALQHSCKETSQDAEDAARFRFCLENGFPQKWEEMVLGSLRCYWTSSAGAQEEFPSAIEAIDHARHFRKKGISVHEFNVN